MVNMVFATASAPRTRTSTLRTKFDLVDSRDLFGDEEALRAVLRRDGYIFMRGLLYPDWVQDIGRHALTALQDAGWTEPGVDPFDAAPQLPVRAVAMRDAFSDPGYRDILLDPAFNDIPYESPLAWLMRQIMGPEGFCHPLKLPRVVYPASVVPRHPGNFVHKDFASVQDMLTSWIPLQHVPTSLGGLALQPGSQTSTRVRRRPLERLERGWRTTVYEPGDVLIFHCLTSHAAMPNREERLRISAEYRWQMADQPTAHPKARGSWGQELGSRQFRRTDWWRPVPAGLSHFDGPAQQESAHRYRSREVVPPSRFVDFP
jgi:Phytanoyl-CoA dioxygenase (PhyH)